MLAHWHGQIWNGAEFGRSFGVSDTTVRRYLDQLTAALVVRQLQPWHANLRKRQVKMPKFWGLVGDLASLPASEANRRPRVVVLSMASHEARAAVGSC